MPTLNLPIQPEGPLLRVEVWRSVSAVRAARKAHQPIPPSIEIEAIIDTGSETTCFDSKIISQLGLPFGGMTMVNVPSLGGLTFAPEHDASLRILHPSGRGNLDLVVSDLLILELDLGTVGYQALLGRDVLASCDFLYQGPAGQFQLTY